MNELKNESVNLVITSPPYYSKRNYGIPDQIGLESTIEDYQRWHPFLDSWAAELRWAPWGLF